MASGASGERGRRWPWFLTRGLLLFACGFVLSGVGYWLDARWLAGIAFLLALAGVTMIGTARALAMKGRWAAWWRRYTTAYDRNVRAAEQRRAAESPPRAGDER